MGILNQKMRPPFFSQGLIEMQELPISSRKRVSESIRLCTYKKRKIAIRLKMQDIAEQFLQAGIEKTKKTDP
jgi:hypothetical protein